jgi:hypothetical protein
MTRPIHGKGTSREHRDARQADPGRPEMIRAESPRLVEITRRDHGVIDINITDRNGLRHSFTHCQGPLYYTGTSRKEE